MSFLPPNQQCQNTEGITVMQIARKTNERNDFCMKLLKGKPTRGRRRMLMLHELANDDGSVTQTGSWGQRGTETQRKDVKNLLYSRKLLMTDDERNEFWLWHKYSKITVIDNSTGWLSVLGVLSEVHHQGEQLQPDRHESRVWDNRAATDGRDHSPSTDATSPAALRAVATVRHS